MAHPGRKTIASLNKNDVFFLPSLIQKNFGLKAVLFVDNLKQIYYNAACVCSSLIWLFNDEAANHKFIIRKRRRIFLHLFGVFIAPLVAILAVRIVSRPLDAGISFLRRGEHESLRHASSS
jgi:hypothetical protein